MCEALKLIVGRPRGMGHLKRHVLEVLTTKTSCIWGKHSVGILGGKRFVGLLICLTFQTFDWPPRYFELCMSSVSWAKGVKTLLHFPCGG